MTLKQVTFASAAVLEIVPWASRHLLAQRTAAQVTLDIEIVAHVFSFSSLRAGSVVGFVQYTTSSRIPHLRVDTVCQTNIIMFFFAWSMYALIGQDSVYIPPNQFNYYVSQTYTNKNI